MAAQLLTLPELVSGVALVGGLVAFVRGLGAYRSGSRVSNLATSPIVGMAAGEVRVTGIVAAGSTTLISPLQSAACVYFCARILSHRSAGGDAATYFSDERAAEFSLRDGTGEVRVFPRGARWELVARFDEHTGLAGEPPPGLQPNTGATMVATPRDREAQIAALLTVHEPHQATPVGLAYPGTGAGMLSDGLGRGLGDDRLAYVEYRVEPGDTVTIVGSAVPFGQLPDLARSPDEEAGDPFADPEIAADLEEARAGGLLRPGAEGWGNAAIPGFGIGHPTRPPELDPEADPEPVDPTAGAGASPVEATPMPGPAGLTEPGFDVSPDTLVLASVAGGPMTIYQGSPGEAIARSEATFWLGVGGAGLAIAAAAALILQLAAR